MNAELETMRERLVKEEESLAKATGKVAAFSKTGPIGLGLVKSIIAVVEAQAKEIEALKKRLG